MHINKERREFLKTGVMAAAAHMAPLEFQASADHARLTPADRYWLAKTRELNWSEIDGPDPYWLNRINWYSIYKGMRPYPARAGEQPGAEADDD